MLEDMRMTAATVKREMGGKKVKLKVKGGVTRSETATASGPLAVDPQQI